MSDFKPHECAAAVQRLSPRQRQILIARAQCRSTKEIAGDLGLSVSTVEAHCDKAYSKLNIHSIAEATRYALAAGLL